MWILCFVQVMFIWGYCKEEIIVCFFSFYELLRGVSGPTRGTAVESLERLGSYTYILASCDDRGSRGKNELSSDVSNQ